MRVSRNEKKKLLFSKYDFYEPYKENIFVVNNGNCIGLKEFIEKEYDPVDLDLKEYDAQNWLDSVIDLKC